MTMTLYGLPGACSMAPHIVMEELGLDYELVLCDRDKLNTPEHLAVNPMAQVPSLVTDDGLLTESVAILIHLAEKDGKGGLMPPPGSWERGQMMMRMLFLASQEHPAFGLWLRPFRWLDDGDEQGRLKAAAEKRFAVCFQRLEGWLEGRDWLIGDHMTLADTLAFVHARWGLRMDPPTTEYPNIWRFAKNMAEVPSVQRAMEQEGVRLNADP
ncbi:MAG: glutathione S-transferase family protein [Proteobacteria bacterium]|nr:glutathione S-transferase family protein [Pseudomonadota bacterium]